MSSPVLPDEIRRRKRRRLVIIGLVVVAVIAVRWSGVTQAFSAERIQTAVAAAGTWGVAVYMLFCLLRDLHQVPGFVMVSAGVLAYGEVRGGMLAFAGILSSVLATFLLVRRMGGGSQFRVERPRIRRMLAHVETRPIFSVCLMRFCFGSSTIVNVPLALSPVRFRDYCIGSAVGLIPPTLLAMGLMSLLFGP